MALASASASLPVMPPTLWSSIRSSSPHNSGTLSRLHNFRRFLSLVTQVKPCRLAVNRHSQSSNDNGPDWMPAVYASSISGSTMISPRAASSSSSSISLTSSTTGLVTYSGPTFFTTSSSTARSALMKSISTHASMIINFREVE
ncbi:hypothetical protein SDC9_79330 [bioreactor metagenome]|uniref:Uncharacterized protein n=1 Tax=bioreactor metagenome TaxID=1076179 RepID=A0A644YVZ8_9ZZZZ